MRVDNLATIDNGVRVAPSSIPEAGNGLFAAATFSRKSYITLHDGETLTAKEAWSRPLLTHMAGREGVVVDGIKCPISGRGGGSFANASQPSCDANAEIVAWLGLLVLRAKRTILDGEEIFVHYGRRGFALAMPTPQESQRREKEFPTKPVAARSCS